MEHSTHLNPFLHKDFIVVIFHLKQQFVERANCVPIVLKVTIQIKQLHELNLLILCKDMY